MCCTVKILCCIPKLHLQSETLCCTLKLCGMYSHTWFSKFCIPVYSEHLCWIPHLRLRYNGLAKIMSEAEWRCSWIHSTEWRTCHLSRLVDMPLWLTLTSTGTGHLTLVIFRIRERGKKLYRMLQNFPYNWKGFQKFCISQPVEIYISFNVEFTVK